MGMQVELVGDPAIDPIFKEFLEQLGARIHIVHEHLEVGGYQVPRLRKVQELLKNNPGAHWVRQYDNSANPQSYEQSALHIAAEVGKVDVLVAPVGSGGSISGTVRKLRMLGHPANSFAVDTHGSVLFGQVERLRKLRGLGNSILPKNLDYSLIDWVSWVEPADAFCSMRKLFVDHGLDMGPTTGASFMLAEFLARENPNKTVVFLGPDRAERYLSTAAVRLESGSREM
jgi:cysteine synthase